MSIFQYPYSMWRKDDIRSLVRRIETITPNSKRKWGTMSVAGMIAHCTLALEVYSRDFELPMHTHWYSPLSKVFALSRIPFPHGIKLPFELPKEDGLDLESERSILLEAIERFASLPVEHKFQPHFLLGEMTREEFGILAYKHTDHHLRQFGC